ncbi:MAG: ABC transporter substrate-binding protein [Geminicoccaceae bacterium]
MEAFRFGTIVAASILTGAMAIAPLEIAGAAEDVPGVTDDTIVFGSFGTLNGPTYLFGELPMNGVEVVFHEVNEAGGVNGRKLELVREDDRCDPATAIAAVKKLIYEENVFAIIGGGCSNATLATRPEIEKSGVPFIVFASVADPISHPPAANIFSTALTASTESTAQLDFALERGAQKIAIVAEHDAWGRARYDPLMEAFEERSVEPIVNLEMAIDANDATAQALQIKQAGADAVILVLYPKPAAILARDLHNLGETPLLVGQSAMSDPLAFAEQVGIPGATDNFYTINQVAFTPTDPQAEKWAKLIEEAFPGDRLSPYNLFGVGAAKVAVEALTRAGPDLTRENFIEALGSISGFDAEVYAGPITCGEPPRPHQCNRSPAWLTAKDGQLVVVD